MDWESVKEKVTREVLRQLEVAQREPGAPASVTVDESFKCDVLLVLGGPVTGRVAVAARAMAAGSRVVAVAAEGTEGLGALDGVVPVLTGGTDTSVRRLVQGASVILAPVATVSLAAKVSSLIGDCFPSAVLVQAALSGKAAVIARDGLVEYEGGNWAVRRKVEEIISTLRSLGITVGEQPADLPATGPTAAAPAKVAAAVVTAARAEVAVGSPEGEYDQALAGMIDHTLLKPEATAEQVAKLCSEARQYGFMSVCVNPTWVPLAAEQLKGSAVKVCTVLGFPLGATASEVKAFEADWTIRHGATEVDMVLNVGALKSGNHDLVLSDVKAVVEAARGRALVKVILETGLLTEAEKVTACEICKEAGADFVKTSTGFGPGGATVDDIALMRRTVGPTMGVKASGGIRDYDAALAVARAGASRIGASASINIVKRVKAQPAAGKEKY